MVTFSNGVSAASVEGVFSAAMSSEIARFFSGQSLLLTGATGFVGRALLFKLLKSCPQLQRVYVVVRRKKKKSAQERVREILEEARILTNSNLSKVFFAANGLQPIHGYNADNCY
ncbi:hypothetical protein J437_LFUL010157, partial [Ladona fulva]